MKKLLPLLLIFIVCSGYSQTTFIKGWSIWCEYQQNNMQQTADHGYIICTDAVPEMDSVNQLAWCYLIKLDASGNTQWMKKFAKSSYFVKAQDGNAVVQTSDGGYAIGTVMYTTSPSTMNSHTAIYVVKTDGNGNFLWSGLYPGIGNSSAYCIQETSNQDLVIAGNTVDTTTPSPTYYDYLMRINSSGNFIWGKAYSTPGYTYSLYSVSQTSDNGFIVCGDNNSGMVAKLDAMGNVTWARQDSSAGTSQIGDVIELSGGAGYVSCSTDYGNPGGATMIKYDLAGTPQWCYSYPPSSYSSNSGYDYSYSVVEADGGFTMSLAETGGNARGKLLHTNSSGIPVWSRDYKFTSYFLPIDLENTDDNGYAFCSGYYDAVGNWMVSMVKTDSLGRASCADSLLIDSVVTCQLPNPISLTSMNFGQRLPATTTIFNEYYPDLDYCNQHWEGVAEQPDRSPLQLYPNPADQELHVDLSAYAANVKCAIFNSLGQEVYQQQFNSGAESTVIPTEELPDGIYFIRLSDRTKGEQTGRFIVSH